MIIWLLNLNYFEKIRSNYTRKDFLCNRKGRYSFDLVKCLGSPIKGSVNSILFIAHTEQSTIGIQASCDRGQTET